MPSTSCKNETWTPEFLSLNPNGKIPAIIDPDGPGGKPIGLFESGAILLYLADKTGKLLPADPARRYETIQWVFFQMAAIGPMFGQLGFFHKFAGKDIADKRPLERYVDESKRLLGVLETRLKGRKWIMDDDYTIADIAHVGWVRNLIGFYDAGDLVGIKDFPNVPAWLDRALARPASQRASRCRQALASAACDARRARRMPIWLCRGGRLRSWPWPFADLPCSAPATAALTAATALDNAQADVRRQTLRFAACRRRLGGRWSCSRLPTCWRPALAATAGFTVLAAALPKDFVAILGSLGDFAGAGACLGLPVAFFAVLP